MTGSIAAIFAHPDDEVFSIGGAIARHAAAGVRCTLFCATDGDAGRASGIAVQSRAELASLRRSELDRGAAILGFDPPTYGGFPDGALAGVDPDVLIGMIVEHLRRARPSIVITFGPEGAPNTHRDHRAISRAATAAFFAARIPTLFADQIEQGLAPHAPARLFYVAWPDPPANAELPARSLPVTAWLDVAPFRETKRRSFLEHATQRDHLHRFEALGLTTHEGFHLAAGVAQPRPVIDDLFAGLRSAPIERAASARAPGRSRTRGRDPSA